MSSSSDNQKQSIVPDGPVMRSVMVGAAPPMSIPAPSRIGIPKPRKFAASAKPRPTVKISNTSAWNVSTVPPLPTLYPLERTNATTTRDVPSVCNAISQSLQQQSIHAIYNESTASCETVSHCRFVIQLFENDSNQLTVEIQRRSGCSYEFHCAAREILAVVTTGAPPRAVEPKPTFEIPSSIASSPDQQDAAQEALDVAQDLLSQNRLDARLMGMESLAALSKTHAEFVSQEITKECPLQKAVLDLVVVNNTNRDFLDELEQDYNRKMHLCALQVLSHCCVTNVADDALLSSLVQELSMAPQSPHEACAAAKCLLASCRATASNLDSDEFLEAMETATTCRHAELQLVTSKLYAAATERI